MKLINKICFIKPFLKRVLKNIVENDLISLENWENTWLLRFNTAKCKVLHFDMNNNPCNEYVLDGSKLAVVDFEKDLGLLISKVLNGMSRLRALWVRQTKQLPGLLEM